MGIREMGENQILIQKVIGSLLVPMSTMPLCFIGMYYCVEEWKKKRFYIVVAICVVKNLVGILFLDKVLPIPYESSTYKQWLFIINTLVLIAIVLLQLWASNLDWIKLVVVNFVSDTLAMLITGIPIFILRNFEPTFYRTMTGSAFPLTKYHFYFFLFTILNITLFKLFAKKIFAGIRKWKVKARGIWGSLIILYYIYTIAQFKEYSDTQELITTGFLISACLFTIVIVLLYWKYQKDKIKMLKMEVDNLHSQRKLMEEHYNAFWEHIQRTRKFRHDIAKHIQMMEVLFQKGYKTIDEIEVLEYREELIKKHEELNKIDFCSDMVLDALLYEKISVCKQKNIKNQIKVEEVQKIVIDKVDFFNLVNHLFNMAIEVCETIEADREKDIFLKLKSAAGIVQLQITYSAKKDRYKRKKNNRNKEDTKQMELSIVKEITERYGGNIESKEEAENTITTVIMMNSLK